MSLAVLFCGIFAFAEKPVNVVQHYMDNYTDPYYYKNKIDEDGDTVGFFDAEDVLMNDPKVTIVVGAGAEQSNIEVPRYHVIGTPWVTEGLIGELGKENFADGAATCWHVDLAKGKSGRIRGTLTITSGWGDFAASFDNMKVFQKTKSEVPAGKYDLNVNWGQDKSGAKYTFLVVTKGTSLPDTTDLVNGTDPNVLGYVRLSVTEGSSLAGKVPFELAEAASLTVGLVASFPAHENSDEGYCSAIGDFELIKWVEGTNYDDLVSKYNQVKRYDEKQYPIGEIPGKYSQEAWDAFKTARDAAKAIVENIPEGNPIEDPNYQDTATQAEVDAALEALNTALDNLNASLILPVKFSTDTKTYYYKVSDMRDPADFWVMEEAALADGITMVPRLVVVDEFVKEDKMLFKFVKKADSDEFFIYSKLDEANPLTVHANMANMILIDAASTPVTWNFRASTAEGAQARFVVFTKKSGHNQLNGKWGGNTFVGLWNDTKDVGNAWKFERVYLDGEVDYAALNDAVITAKTMKEENYPTGTGLAEFSQEKWDAFVAARTTALAVLDKEQDNSGTQEEVDAAATALQTAIDELEKSLSNPFLFSNDAEEHYYLIHDKRTKLEEGERKPNYCFWRMQEVQVQGEATLRARYSKQVANDNDSLKFKFVKAEDGVHFNIFSKLKPNQALSIHPDDKNVVFVDPAAALDPASFKLGRTPARDVKYFTIGYLAQDDDGNTIYNQLNSFGGNDAGDIGVWNPSGDDDGNDWAFVEKYDTGVKNVSVVDLGVYVKERRILSTDQDAVLNVYSISGQKVNVKRQLNPGVYIVTVAGKQGAAKVIVK